MTYFKNEKILLFKYNDHFDEYEFDKECDYEISLFAGYSFGWIIQKESEDIENAETIREEKKN